MIAAKEAAIVSPT